MKLNDGDIVLNADNTLGYVYGDKVLCYMGEIPLETFKPVFAIRYDGKVSIAEAAASVLDKPPVYGSHNVANAMLQAGLKTLGHDPGEIDGWYGSRTEAALQQYLSIEKLDKETSLLILIKTMIGDSN